MGTKRTRICRAAVTAIALMICFGIAVEAAGVTTIGENHLVGTFKIMRRASNSFDVTIPAGEIMAAETSFSMSAGESVKFHAVYEPREASVDYGLISPDGLFHPLTRLVTVNGYSGTQYWAGWTRKTYFFKGEDDWVSDTGENWNLKHTDFDDVTGLLETGWSNFVNYTLTDGY